MSLTKERVMSGGFARLSGAVGVCMLVVGCAAPVTQRVSVDDGARAREERTQQMLALKTQAELTRRLWSVGYAVLKGAAGECKDAVRQSVGVNVLSRQRLPEKTRELTAAALGLDDAPRVYAVYKGGAAEAAGIRAGDVLLDAASPAITPAGNESREAALKRLPKGIAFPVRLRRNGADVALSLTPDTVCDYPLQVVNGAEVNAYADGKGIFVTRGMMRFAAEDRELALVIGHELGHNTMGHVDKKKTNAAIGAIFDILAASRGINTQSAFTRAGAQSYSQAFEAEADYVGLYYLARAGHDTQGAADFWRRMAAEHPGSIRNNHAASHPATTERFLSLEKISTEVRLKQSRGLALTPDLAK